MTGKQLVQGCYAVAWGGVEPTTFELQGRTLSTEPRRPVNDMPFIQSVIRYCSLYPPKRVKLGSNDLSNSV